MLWPEGLTEGLPLCLALLGDIEVLVPGQVNLGAVLGVGHADFLEQVDSIGHGRIRHAVRDTQISAVHRRRVCDELLEAASCLGERLGLGRQVHQVVLVQVVPGRPQLHDVHAAGLDSRRDLRLQVGPVQEVGAHLDAVRLAPLRGLLLVKVLPGGDEVRPLQDRQLRPLDDRRRLAEDLSGQRSEGGDAHAGGPDLQELTPTQLLPRFRLVHPEPPLEVIAGFSVIHASRLRAARPTHPLS